MSSTTPKTIGWYGLGSMGLPMAQNLHRHLLSTSQPPLHFSNRTPTKGAPLAAAGAIPHPDIVALARTTDVLITMLSADGVLRGLVQDVLAAPPPDAVTAKVWIDCSTIHPDTAREVEALLAAKGWRFVASPVFGASPVAQAGRLLFAAAGPEGLVGWWRDLVVGVMGRRMMEMGEDVGRSCLLKITGNVLLISFLETIAEVHVLGSRNTLGPALIEDLIAENFGPTLASYSARFTSGRWAPPHDTPPGFAIAHSIKDAKYAARMANDLDLRLPTLDVALGNMLAARAFAGENLDAAGLFGVLRVQAGLPFFSEESRQEP